MNRHFKCTNFGQQELASVCYVCVLTGVSYCLKYLQGEGKTSGIIPKSELHYQSCGCYLLKP